jgi:hypothetical protein
VSRRCWVVLVCLVAMSMASTSVAAEGWSLSKLNPFKKSTADKRTRASVSDDDRSLTLPRPAPKSNGAKRSAEPSTLSKLNQGTKEFFGKTKDVLMPWSKSKKKSVARPVSAKKKVTKTPWYKSLLPQKEPEKKPKTVSEFIGQDRPEL